MALSFLPGQEAPVIVTGASLNRTFSEPSLSVVLVSVERRGFRTSGSTLDSLSPVLAGARAQKMCPLGNSLAGLVLCWPWLHEQLCSGCPRMFGARLTGLLLPLFGKIDAAGLSTEGSENGP